METDLLVISAHTADYVWRAAGTIAKYAKKKKRVQTICLSFGERGESEALWKAGKSLEEIKEIRKEESSRAARIINTPIKFLDWGDYPLNINDERLIELVKLIREYRPKNIITHSLKDPFNFDHVTAGKKVHEASIMSIANGVLPELEVCKQTRLFGFEHHQSEISGFIPEVIIDISDVFTIKRKAMECFQAQKHLIDYYTYRAEIRGNHARRISGNQSYKYAEAFTRFYPYVGGELV